MASRPSAQLKQARLCLAFALHKAACTVLRVYDAGLRKRGLRSTQFALLVVLDEAGPIGTSALAERLAIDRTTLTRNLRLLAARRLIRIERGRDKRSRLVSITTSGRRAALEAFPAWQHAHAQMQKLIGAGQLTDLIAELNALSIDAQALARRSEKRRP